MERKRYCKSSLREMCPRKHVGALVTERKEQCAKTGSACVKCSRESLDLRTKEKCKASTGRAFTTTSVIPFI